MPVEGLLEPALESILRRVIREELQALNRSGQDDYLLTAEEAAKVLSVSPDWLYRKARQLPFTRKLHHKMLRFSYQGIQKYIASRR